MDPSSKRRRISATDNADAEDWISTLPDDLIHNIFSSIDTKFAVQSCILSKRWTNIWKTLPYLNFKDTLYGGYKKPKYYNFISNFLKKRNPQSEIITFSLGSGKDISREKYKEIMKYVINHNVQEFIVSNSTQIISFPLRRFCCPTLKKFVSKVPMSLRQAKSSCQFPALKYLHIPQCDLGKSTLNCPVLETMVLVLCELPKSFVSFPCLRTLHLKSVTLPKCADTLFSELVSLENLVLCNCRTTVKLCTLWLPKLISLEVRHYKRFKSMKSCKLEIIAPSVTKFICIGLNPVMLRDANGLKTVCVDMKDFNISRYGYNLKDVALPVLNLFCGLHNTETLIISAATIEVLTIVSEILKRNMSPFLSLKHVFLPESYSAIPDNIKKYILGNSPTANIITGSSKTKATYPVTPEPTITQMVGLENPMAIMTGHNTVMGEVAVARHKNYDIILQPVPAHGKDKGPIAPQLVVQNQVGSINHMDKFNPFLVPVEVESDDERMLHRGADIDFVDGESHTDGVDWKIGAYTNNELPNGDCRQIQRLYSDEFALWQGHAVSAHFVNLLRKIKERYPETFVHFQPQSNIFNTMVLNLLCTSVSSFSLVSMVDLTLNMVSHFKLLFAELQRWGFNVTWLLNRLNYVEQLRFSQVEDVAVSAIDRHIADFKKQLQDLHALRVAVMEEINESLGHFGTSLPLSNLGDGLFSSH